ncbi:MAG: hypothetical protein AB7K09_00320 [Planctomycetota bacterium]
MMRHNPSLVVAAVALWLVPTTMTMTMTGCDHTPAAAPDTSGRLRFAVPAAWEDMVRIQVGEAMAAGDITIVPVKDEAMALEQIATGTAHLALLPDDAAIIDVDRFHRCDLIRVRVGTISESGKPLWLCRRTYADTPADPGSRRLMALALSIRGQQIIDDEPGLDRLLPWDLGSERLELASLLGS